MASLSPLFDAITVMIVLALVGSLAAAGGFSRHRIGLITDLVHPLMLALVLIGLVQMLSALNDPAAIGPALAVALAPVPWGLLIVAVLTPLSRHPEGAGDSVKFKALGSVLLTGVLCWCILMGSGPGVFLNIPAVAVVAGGVFIFLLLDRISGTAARTPWALRLLGIGAGGFAAGLIAGLPYIDKPAGLGPALALSLLSLLYSLVLLCFARVWLPAQVLDDAGKMPTGFTVLVLPVLFGISLALALLAFALTGMG